MAIVKAIPRGERINFAKIPEVISIPDLIEIQRRSYEQFLQKDRRPEEREDSGLQGVFTSVFPITDYEDSASLEFEKYEFGAPKYTPEECREKGMTYSVPLKVTLKLVVWDKGAGGESKSIREIKEKEGVYMGEIPLMTEHGTFIINGTERVVVSQLHRSPGVFFDHDGGKTHSSGKLLYSARLIPYRGSWLEFEFDGNDILYVRVDRRRKFLVTVLLRAIGYGSNEEILGLFYDRDAVIVGKKRDLALKLGSPSVLSFRVSQDIVDPKSGELILSAGKKVSKAALKRIQASQIQEIPIDAEDLLGRVLAADVVDEGTGEVLLESARELTPEGLDLIFKRGIFFFYFFANKEENEKYEIR